MAIDFPNSPTLNDTHTSAGVTWKWDGTTWKAEGVTSSYTLPTAAANTKGGIKIGSGLTMTGETLSADSETDTLQTVTARGATSDQPISVGTTATGAIFSVGDSGTSGDKVIQIKRASTTTDCNIQAVIAGTGAGTLKLNDDGGTVTTGGSLQPSGGIIDKDGQLGNAGQVLSSTGSQLDWIDATASAITVQEEGSSLATAATTLNFVGGNVTASGTGAVKTITITDSDTKEPEITWTLGSSGNDYTFTGSGFTGAVADPTLYLIRGQTYKFDNQTGGHPFRIQSTVAQTGGGTQYNSGVTNQDAGNGTTLTFVVPMNAPDTLYYQCTAHPNMTGTIHVITQGGGVGIQSRTTGAATSTGLADAAAGNLTIVAAKSYILHKIQTSHAAWVTVYTDSTARTNDAARSESTDPLPGTGVIAEVITSDGATQPITPGTIGWNNEGTPTTNAYVKVVNKSGSTADVTVTLHFVSVEA